MNEVRLNEEELTNLKDVCYILMPKEGMFHWTETCSKTYLVNIVVRAVIFRSWETNFSMFPDPCKYFTKVDFSDRSSRLEAVKKYFNSVVDKFISKELSYNHTKFAETLDYLFKICEKGWTMVTDLITYGQAYIDVIYQSLDADSAYKLVCDIKNNLCVAEMLFYEDAVANN